MKIVDLDKTVADEQLILPQNTTVQQTVTDLQFNLEWPILPYQPTQSRHLQEKEMCKTFTINSITEKKL